MEFIITELPFNEKPIINDSLKDYPMNHPEMDIGVGCSAKNNGMIPLFITYSIIVYSPDKSVVLKKYQRLCASVVKLNNHSATNEIIELYEHFKSELEKVLLEMGEGWREGQQHELVTRLRFKKWHNVIENCYQKLTNAGL
ncbi:MAG TPA: hypothetical protein VGN20_19390 [Mucilaginibacter sp.]|jgi:hypothetical protein